MLHMLRLIQTLLLVWSTSIYASMLNMDGGIEDIHTVFDSRREMIGTGRDSDILETHFPFE